MKKEQMVGARVSPELVRGLELIEDVEQSDRSTTVRRLLSQAIRQWKLEHYCFRRVPAAISTGILS